MRKVKLYPAFRPRYVVTGYEPILDEGGDIVGQRAEYANFTSLNDDPHCDQWGLCTHRPTCIGDTFVLVVFNKHQPRPYEEDYDEDAGDEYLLCAECMERLRTGTPKPEGQWHIQEFWTVEA